MLLLHPRYLGKKKEKEIRREKGRNKDPIFSSLKPTLSQRGEREKKSTSEKKKKTQAGIFVSHPMFSRDRSTKKGK